MRPLLLLLLCVSAIRADDVDRYLRDLRGNDNEAARVAYDELIKLGPKYLPHILEAMNKAKAPAANWLRLAFDAIVEATPAKDIDTTPILKFVRNDKHSGLARRLALDLLEQVSPGTRDTVYSGLLDDSEFRYEAIAWRLDRLAKDKTIAKDKAIELLRQTFVASRDIDQSRAVASRLKELGITLSVADHMGFLREWWVIGPLDASGGKGFKKEYPPEVKVDLSLPVPGKIKPLTWKRITVAEAPGGRFPILVDLRKPLGDARDAVAYAYTEFKLTKAQTVEFRGSADDNFTVWVNGRREFGFEEYQNGVRLDRHRFNVQLKEGVNTVLVKICQAPEDAMHPALNWEFLLRITDTQGRGVSFPTNLKEK